eukprot:TRINITY_DN8121_c0_g4_i1.p1 TRINITY_DN8121_c0_g4~~TRINITY_DN8121_c0_g4_i1.p1  ORF type:complete len:218 (+),score=56.73 TRINITY_DN8121_c0_g4_i1:15-668(+)
MPGGNGTQPLLVSEASQWHTDWEANHRQRRQQQMRRRALLSLALISEPMERQWDEIFLDLAWSAWKEMLLAVQRERLLPEAQRMYEKAAAEVSCLPESKLGAGQLQELLQLVMSEALPQEISTVVSAAPKDEFGQVSLQTFLSWMFGSPKTSLESAQPRWGKEWQELHRAKQQSRGRRQGIFALSVIAEPSKLRWQEVFVDLAWSAWCDAVSEARRM